MENQKESEILKENDFAVEGLKKAFDVVSMYKDQTDGTFTVIRDTTKTFFTACNLLLAIIVSLNVFFVKVQPDFVWVYNSLLIFLTIVYIGFMALCIINLIPVKRVPPFIRDYDSLTKDLCVSELDRWAMLVNAYLISIDKNSFIVNRRVKIMIWSGALFGLMIVLIILMAMVPKVSI